MKARLIKCQKITNENYDYIEWGAEKAGVIWATVYQGYLSWKRTPLMKALRNWYYVVKFVDGSNWRMEHYGKFREARKRALEIAESKF